MKDIESVIELFRQLQASGIRNVFGGSIGPAMNTESNAFRAWFPDFASVTVEAGDSLTPYRRYVAVKEGIEFSCLSAEPIYEEEQK